jgi:hypothetical protein
MATTTPNYGWPVPTSTDLVKDGATAIEALGDAIDTTLATLAPKILQVVTASTTTSTTIASTSFTDTTLTATITPSATSSKILVLFAHPFSYTRTASENGVGIQLLRGATSIYDLSQGGGYTNYLQIAGMTYFNFYDVVTGMYLDSPASASALTYKTQARVASTANAGASYWNNARATITLLEIKG